MILAGAIGYAVQRWFGFESGLLLGLFLGLLVAPLVPGPRGCAVSLPRRDPSGRG